MGDNMRLIEAKCPKCKEVITVDGDSDSTKCDKCGDRIDIKDAIIEMMMSSKDESHNNIDEAVIEEEVEEPEIIEEAEEVEEVEDVVEELRVKKILDIREFPDSPFASLVTNKKEEVF